MSTSRSRCTGPTLPVDTVELIADFLFETTYLADSDAEITGNTFVLPRKPSWSTVAGFMSASADLHRIGMERWVRMLICRSKEDLDIAIPYFQWIRDLRCFDQPPLDSEYGTVLNQFVRLRSLSIDLHNDIHHNERQFSYRDIFTSLPSSLLRLEIKNSHGPDVKIIAIVKRCCPKLQELRLGRCNMFNRTPACQFWRSFPFEHDSYISSDGTDEYASSLAQELAPLKRLKTLQVGIYLIPTSVVLAHRIYHAQEIPAPNDFNWQQAITLARHAPAALAGQAMPPGLEPATADDLIDLLHKPNSEPGFSRQSCRFCELEFSQANIDAESNATRTLKVLLPSLAEVQWQSWFTPNHLGVSSRSCHL
ncbi:hypothetical protein RHS03_09216, partial [Rhizoctonia solani]